MKRCFAFCSFVLVATARLFGDESFFVYAADGQNQQLLNIAVSVASGKVTARTARPLKMPFGPTSIARHPDGRRLIVSSPLGKRKGGSNVATVSISGRGALRLDDVSKIGAPTGYTSVDRRGKFFLMTSYKTGQVSVFRLTSDGRVGRQVCTVKTPLPEAHCVLTTPDNRFVYIPCVKLNNALFQYAFDETTGQLTPLEPLNAKPPAMFGPRHVAYHPSQPIAYFSNEQQLGVSVYDIGEDGQLTAREHAVTMARRSPYVKGERGRHASDLVMTPDGQRLFVAVRDFVGDDDSVFTFRVESDGRLSKMAQSKVGDIPWKLDLSSDGKSVFVSESGDKTLSIFEVQPDGSLESKATVDWGAPVRDMVVVAH